MPEITWNNLILEITRILPNWGDSIFWHWPTTCSNIGQGNLCCYWIKSPKSVLCLQGSSVLWLWGFKIDSTLFLCVKINNSEIMKCRYSSYKKSETAQWSLLYASHKWSKWLHYLLSTHLLMVFYKQRTIYGRYYGEWNNEEDTDPVVMIQWGRGMYINN